MITFDPMAKARDDIIALARALNIPGTAPGAVVDATPHIRRLAEGLYGQRYVIANLIDSPGIRAVANALGSGQSTGIGGIMLFPPASAEQMIINLARMLKMPGVDGGLIDAKPHMRNLVAELYRRGKVLAYVGQGQLAEQVLQRLATGNSASVDR